MSDRQQLLRKASQCYLNAGLVDDACRCFEILKDYIRAARLHEQQKRWKEAAQAYSQVQAWLDAARCYEFGNQLVDAADCYLNANEQLKAAWILAEHAHYFKRAHNIAHAINPDTLAESLLREIILARCDVGFDNNNQAAEYLNRVINQLNQLESTNIQFQSIFQK